ncbi:unnamed protein product [Cyclocybe aegerita]|uniref:Uncharacterized protein n=1 Tax=Cyclocybe aegerita TaxID=1973307 RepID=A0A8S0WAS7_CYCAE|nr:unnamed protein product [Cyclocybe aegerita]
MSPRDHTPRLDGSQLAALIFETACNGVFWVLLVQAVEALWSRAKARHESFFRPMTFTGLALFITITGHWLMDFLTAFQAFILPQDVEYTVQAFSLNPAETVYLTLADPKTVAGSAFYVSTTLLGDMFMIYRLYIVWSRNKYIIIPPIILCTALAVTGSMVTYLFSQSTEPIFATAGAWITSCFVLTFICNFYSTFLIAFKIFMTNRKLGRGKTDNLGMSKIMEILVESAALYSCCVILSLATYVAESNTQYAMVAVTNPIIGIIFCMIVTRAHRAGAGSSVPSYRRSGLSGNAHPLRPVTIKITTQSQNDSDGSYPKAAEFGTPPTSPHYMRREDNLQNGPQAV